MYINIYIIQQQIIIVYIHIDIFKIIETCCYWLHIIQLQDPPFHFLIKVLKTLMFSAVLILKGRAFQILGPQDLRLLVPNVTWFVLGIFKFNLYLSRTTRLFFFTSKILIMKSGFKLLLVLYISIHKNLIRRKFMLHFPDFSSSCSYEFSQSFRRNLRASLM